MLNFSRSEFNQLTLAAMEIYAAEYGDQGLLELMNNTLSGEDDVLLSQTVS